MSNGMDNLQQTLRALAASDREASASPAVKSMLLKEIRGRRRRAWMVRWWPAAATAAAALTIGIWLGAPRRVAAPELAWKTHTTPVEPAAPAGVIELPSAPPEAPAQPAAVRTPRATLARSSQLTPLTPWYVHTGLVPVRQGQVVYLDVGPETARQFGLSIAGPMKAEVFVGDDGMARAIRLVRTSQIAKGE